MAKWANAGDMGIGPIGQPSTIIKRKFRWLLSIDGPCGSSIGDAFVKVAGRPNLSIEETEINFLNAKTWIPGKAAWETITITYIDVGGDDNIGLWDWIASVYNFTGSSPKYHMGNSIGDYSGIARLKMLDSCGNWLESWELKNAWPQAINFGDLDMSSSEEATIEITLRYSEVSYLNWCGRQPQGCTCSPCENTSGGGTVTSSNFDTNAVDTGYLLNQNPVA